MKFTIPIRTVSTLNAREHHHARARRVKAEREATAWAWKMWGPRRGSGWDYPITVTFTRIAPRLLDDDGCVAAMKAARDQVADELGLPNDRDPRVQWRYAQKKGGVREYAVLVEIT